MRPDDLSGTRRRHPRAVRRSTLGAWLVGLLLSATVALTACAVAALLNWEECSGEYRPFLGSGKQAFAIYGCLARDAGPLIDLKKRLGIYDPRWTTVVK